MIESNKLPFIEHATFAEGALYKNELNLFPKLLLLSAMKNNKGFMTFVKRFTLNNKHRPLEIRPRDMAAAVRTEVQEVWTAGQRPRAKTNDGSISRSL